MTKRIVAVFMLMLLVLGMCSVATAEPEIARPTEAKIPKEFVLQGAGESPAETFTFTSTFSKVTQSSIPESEKTEALIGLGTATVTYAAKDATVEGAEKEIAFKFPDYKYVGVYEYTITETPGGTAGVTYLENPVTLTVWVAQGEENDDKYVAGYDWVNAAGTKSGALTNTYSAGTLSISKEVTGNLGDRDIYFEVDVKLINTACEAVNSAITFTHGSHEDITKTAFDFGVDKNAADASVTIQLKHGDTVNINNIPVGIGYEVKEKTYDDYKTSYVGDVTGTIIADKSLVAITNNKEIPVGTGVWLDNLPYLLMLGIVLLAGAAFLVKRRMALGRD